MAKPEQLKITFSPAVSTRINEDLLREVDPWASAHLSDRSKICRGILEKVFQMVMAQGGLTLSPRELIDRIQLRPA